jgi:L-ribulose-5-phosphate 3-epimerase
MPHTARAPRGDIGDGPTEHGMRKGINRWCFPATMPLERVLDLSEEAGFDGVELAVSEYGEIPFTGDPSDLKRVAERAETSGLELFSISTDLHWTYPLSSPDAEVRGLGLEAARFMVEAAAVVGADTVLIVPGVADPEVPYLETYRLALGSLRELAGFAGERGVSVGVENVWNRFLQGPLEMRRFIEEVGSPRVGAYLDVGNVVAFGYPEHWIQVLSDRIVKVHVKDFSTAVGNIHGFRYLLHGDVPWDAVMRELRAVGYDGFVTPELAPSAEHPERLVRETGASLAAIMGEGT